MPVADLRASLEESGFVVEIFEDTTDVELRRTSAGAVPGLLTLATFVDTLTEKSGNSRRSLEEGRIRLVRGVFRAD